MLPCVTFPGISSSTALNENCTVSVGHRWRLGLLRSTRRAGSHFQHCQWQLAGLNNAINTANSNGEPDTINLATNGTYTLTAVNNTTSNGANGLPAIRHESSNVVSDLIINGNGATLQRAPPG